MVGGEEWVDELVWVNADGLSSWFYGLDSEELVDGSSYQIYSRTEDQAVTFRLILGLEVLSMIFQDRL